MGTAASCASHGNAVAPHDQYRVTDSNDHHVIAPADGGAVPTRSRTPKLISNKSALALSLVSTLDAVKSIGIGLVLDLETSTISWNCAATEDTVDAGMPCRAELRLGGPDGHAVLTLKLAGPSVKSLKEIPFGTCVAKGVDGLDVFPPSPSPSSAVASLRFPTTTARDGIIRLLHSLCGEGEASSPTTPSSPARVESVNPANAVIPLSVPTVTLGRRVAGGATRVAAGSGSSPAPAEGSLYTSFSTRPGQAAVGVNQTAQTGKTIDVILGLALALPARSHVVATVSGPDPAADPAAASPDPSPGSPPVTTGHAGSGQQVSSGPSAEELIKAGVNVDKERRVFQFNVDRITTRRHKLKANETLAVEYTAVCVIGDGSSPPVLQLFRTAAEASATNKPTASDVADGVALSVCLLDPVPTDAASQDKEGNSPSSNGVENPFHLRVYAFTPQVDDGQPSKLIKLKLKFKSAPDVILRLLSSCFEGRTGSSVLDGLPSSIGATTTDFTVPAGAAPPESTPGRFRRFCDQIPDRVSAVLDTAIAAESYVGEKAALWPSVVSTVGSVLSTTQSIDAGAVAAVVDQVMTIAGPAMQFVTNLAASVPFAGTIATAINGIFDAYQLVKSRSSAVAQFLALLGDVSLRFTDILSRCVGKMPKEPGWKPDGSDDLTQCLRESFKLVYSLTKQNVIAKFLKANDTIAKLADKGTELQACLKAVQKAVKETVAELQLEFMGDMRAFASYMKAANDELMRTIKAMSAKQDAASESSLSAIAKLMDVKAEDMKACMKTEFEALTAEIVKQFDKDVGPYRLIQNATFRYIWKNYLVGSDHVSRDTFIAALGSYWASKWEAMAGEVGPVEDALLTSANVASLMNLMDSDGNGKVYVTEVNTALQQASLILKSDTISFEDMIKQLVLAGKQQVVKKLLAVHLTQFEDRKHELEAYIHPLVIKEVPGNMSLTEYVAKLDKSGVVSSSEVPVTLTDGTSVAVPQFLIPKDDQAPTGVFEEEFLRGESSLFLLLGEPGSGKSLFSWHRCKLKEKEYASVRDGLKAMSEADPWIPIAIDLKNYSLNDIKGLLSTHLEKVCKLSRQELSMLRGLLQSQSESSTEDEAPDKLKLLVFCDGFDELRAEESGSASQVGFTDFTKNLLDGLNVKAKVVVTCRDRHLKGGREEENRVFQHAGKPYVRRVLLPFRDVQIDEYIDMWINAKDTARESRGADSDIAVNEAPSSEKHVLAGASGDAEYSLRIAPTGTEKDASKPVSSVTSTSAASVRKLSLLQYQLTIRSSDSLQQIVRNPFVLRLFVDALPQLSDANGRVDVSSVTKHAIYSVFVRQYIGRQLKEKCRLDGGKWMLSETSRASVGQEAESLDDTLLDDVERLCCEIAGRMFAKQSLTIKMDKQQPMWSSLRNSFFEFDAMHVESRARSDWNAMSPVDQFPFKCAGVDEKTFVERAVRDAQHCRWVALKHATILCPLRKLGDGYAFLHKSFYEYFLAQLVLSVGSDPLRNEEQRVQQMTSVLNSRRAWQTEPEAIYFLCDKWWASRKKEETQLDVVQLTRECMFGVVKASAVLSSELALTSGNQSSDSVEQQAESGGVSASANAATILNWLNEPFSGVQWDGVQLAGADLSYAVFVGASLRGANLSHCMLKKAVLSGADLTGANLEGVNFAERAPAVLEEGVAGLVRTHGLFQHGYHLVGGAVKVYSTTTGKYGVSLYGNTSVKLVTAADGRIAGACEDGSVVIWEVANFQRVWCTPADTLLVTSILLNKHVGRTALVVGRVDGSISFWDIEAQEALSHVPLIPDVACTAICLDDTSTCVGVGFESGAIRVFRIQDTLDTLVELKAISGDGIPITAIARSSGSLGVELQFVAACFRDSNSVKVWRCITGDFLHALSSHEKPVKCVAFSPPVQGRPLLLATGSDDHECRLWDVAAGQQYGPALQGHLAAVLSVEFEAGEHGMLVSLGADKCIRYWDVDSANAYQERLQVSQKVVAIVGNHDGARFVSLSEDGGLFSWDMSRAVDGTRTALMPRWLQRADVVKGSLVTGFGHIDGSGVPDIAIGGTNGALKLWRNGSTVEFGKFEKPISAVCFVGPDFIAVGTDDGTVQVWSMEEGASSWVVKTLDAGDGKRIAHLAGSADQYPLLACAAAYSVHCWNLNSGGDEPLFAGGASHCTSMRFGPPGHKQLLAVGMIWGSKHFASYGILLRDARSGDLVRALTGHTSDVTAFCWLSPSRLVSGSTDCTIRVWDVETGLCVQTVVSVSKIRQLLHYNSARALVALCEDGILRVWDDTAWEFITQSRSHIAGPFASEAYGMVLSSSNDGQLMKVAGLDSDLGAILPALTVPTVETPGESDQLYQSLAHRLSVPARISLKRVFLRHARLNGIAEGVQATLLQLIASSKADPSLAVSAGNAASLLSWLCSTQLASPLTGLDWSGVRLTGADLRGADLSDTRFEGALLIDCDFTDAVLTRTDFSGVNLAGSMIISPNRALPGSLFALSPQRPGGGVILASVVDKTVIQVRRPDTGECIAVLKGHTAAVTCLEFGTRSDGRLVLTSGSADHTVRLWDVAKTSGEAVVLRGHTNEVTYITLGTRSHGGLVLASGSKDSTVRVWDVEAGSDSIVLSGHTGDVICLSFGTRSDGRLLLASGGADHTVRLWDVDAGADSVVVLSGHTNWVRCLSFGSRSDGKLLLASGSDDKTAWLWDVEAGGDAIVLRGHTNSVFCTSFLMRQDGRLWLTSGSRDTSVRLWDIEAGGECVVLNGHTGNVTCLRIYTQSDGKALLASGSFDDNSVRLWDVDAGGEAIAVLRGATKLESLSGQSLIFLNFSQGKLRLFSGNSSNEIWLWVLDPLQSVLSTRRWGARAADPVEDTRRIKATTIPDKQPLRFLEPDLPCMASGEYVATFPLRERRGIVSLAISPDGTRLVVANERTHMIAVYRLPDGALLAEFGGEGDAPGQFNRPQKISVSPRNSGSIFIAEFGNKRVQEMTLAGVHVRTIGEGVMDGNVIGVATCTDMIAACTSGKVFLFDMTSGHLIRSLGEGGRAQGQLRDCNGLRFTSDGGHILIAEEFNDRLSLFTLAGAFVRCIGKGTLNCPYDVDFAANGDILVANCGNHRICVFSADGSTLLRSFGSRGDAPGQFNWPIALAVHARQLYVLDRNSARVQVFN